MSRVRHPSCLILLDLGRGYHLLVCSAIWQSSILPLPALVSPRLTPFTSPPPFLLCLSAYHDLLWLRRSGLNFNWAHRSGKVLSPKRTFIIAPNLETSSPPPESINKGPFSIPLDSAPTRVRFSDPDVQVLAEKNKKFTLVGKIFGDPISPQNIQTRFIGSWIDFQGPFSIDHVGYGWFKVAFTVEEDLQFVLDNRPWFVQGQIFHLQRWFPTFDPAKTTIDHLLVWV
ncbi:hypothetical protein M0R45_036455 [Rubus argutus]|uniref:DUF4283 domain-containing protein n=1 Tax=Rubus argutus TaxID=59490 RepID=A0AAW1VW85_RUBAR